MANNYYTTKRRPFLIRWFQNLTGGIDQATDSTMVSNNASNLLKNVVLDQPGNVATRKGCTKVGNTLGSQSDRGWGLFTYNSTSGAHTLMGITERDLYSYNEGTNTWSVIQADNWPATTKVNSVNFLNRLYLGSADGATSLSYTTGGAVTNVVPKIGGHFLAVNKDIMAVGGNSIKPNVIFYTDPFTDNFFAITTTAASDADVAGANTITIPDDATGLNRFQADMISAIAYNSTDGTMATITGWTSGTVVTTDTDTSAWDGDTIYVLQNTFKQQNACTGMIAYGENFVSWDLEQMYVWNPLTFARKIIPNIGCVNERTIQVVNGYVVWANREGMWLWDGTNSPVDLTKSIRNRVNGFGIWDLIPGSNFAGMASVAIPAEGKYLLTIGNLNTATGSAVSGLTNVMLELEVKSGTWLLRTYPDIFTDYTNFIDQNGNFNTYSVSKTQAVVRKLNTGLTDVNNDGTTTAIAFEVRTPNYLLGSPIETSYIQDYYTKYTSTNAVTVEESVDRADYQALATIPAASSITVIPIKPEAARQGFATGLRWTGTGAFVLEAYGFAVLPESTLRTPAK